MNTISWKPPTRRKEEEFVIYKAAEDGTVVIQSGKSICQIDLSTKKMVANIKGQDSKYFVHLNESLGAVNMDCPDELFNAIKENIPQAGDIISKQTNIVWG
jgi:hypothetical protein